MSRVFTGGLLLVLLVTGRTLAAVDLDALVREIEKQEEPKVSAQGEKDIIDALLGSLGRGSETNGLARAIPSDGEPDGGSVFRLESVSRRQERFAALVKEIADKASPPDTYRFLLREPRGNDGEAVLRAYFSRDVRFSSLRLEFEKLTKDLECRFAACGFGPVAVSENAYVNYAEGVGVIAAFLFADDGKVNGRKVYTMEVSFLKPLGGVSRAADFGDRKTVEDMLAVLSRSAPIAKRVRYRNLTEKEGTTGGDVDLPPFEDCQKDDDRTWASLVVRPACALECERLDVARSPASHDDDAEANECRFEAMKFMNDFIYPCEDGFGWAERMPTLGRDQRRFIEEVREITGRTILPAEAEAPFVTLAEMRRRYRNPTKEVVRTVVDWNSPTNAYRYFPQTSSSVSQSPYSSTMTAYFSSRCTPVSLQSELYGLVGDLERRFADCGFKAQRVGDVGYVNYRPDVGAIAIRFEDPAADGGFYSLSLHFTTRFMEEGPSCGWVSDKKPDGPVKEALLHGLLASDVDGMESLKRFLHGSDMRCSFAPQRPAAVRWRIVPSYDMPVYNLRQEESPSYLGRLVGSTWQSMLVVPSDARLVSCFADPRIDEHVPWYSADEPIAEPNVRYVPVCRYADLSSRVETEGGSADGSAEVKYDRVETNACWRCQAVDSFVERFLAPRTRVQGSDE